MPELEKFLEYLGIVCSLGQLVKSMLKHANWASVFTRAKQALMRYQNHFLDLDIMLKQHWHHVNNYLMRLLRAAETLSFSQILFKVFSFVIKHFC